MTVLRSAISARALYQFRLLVIEKPPKIDLYGRQKRREHLRADFEEKFLLSIRQDQRVFHVGGSVEMLDFPGSAPIPVSAKIFCTRCHATIGNAA